eukprot:6315139-Amphidinium_carterae.1
MSHTASKQSMDEVHSRVLGVGHPLTDTFQITSTTTGFIPRPPSSPTTFAQSSTSKRSFGTPLAASARKFSTSSSHMEESASDPARGGGKTRRGSLGSSASLTASTRARRSNNLSDIVQSTQTSDNTKVGRVEAVVTGFAFEFLFGMVIAANAVVFAFEAQHEGIDIGRQLSYPGSRRSAAQAWPHASQWFEYLWWVFGLTFVAELVVKLAALRCHFFSSWWNLFDVFIVALWFLALDSSILPSAVNSDMMRLARLLRPLRLVRLVKTVRGFDSLHLMLVALRGSMEVLLWSV